MSEDPKTIEDVHVARAGLATHERELAPESAQLVRPSRKRGFVFAFAALVIFGGTVLAFGAYQARVTRAASEAAYADLTQCLLGERPADADAAIVALRRHQVAWMHATEAARRGEERAPWPERCAEPSLRLGDASRDLKETTDKLARALDQNRGLTPEIWPTVRELLDAVEAREFVARTPAVAGPPEHPRALTLDDLPDAAFITRDFVAMRGVERARFPTDAGLIFVNHRADFGPFYCHLRSPLQCGRVAPALAATKTLALVGTSDREPLVLDEAGTVLRAATGHAVARLDVSSAHLFDNDLAIAIGRDQQTRELVYAVQRKPDGPALRLDVARELEPLLDDAIFDGDPANLLVAHGRLFVRARFKEAWTLFVLGITPDGRPSARVMEPLADVSPLSTGLFTCSVAGEIRIIARGANTWLQANPKARTWSPTSPPLLEGVGCSERGRTGSSFAAIQICEPECKLVRAATPEGDVRPGTRAIAPLGAGLALIEAVGDAGGVRTRRSDGTDRIDPNDARGSVLFDDRIAVGAITDLPTMAELRAFAVNEGPTRSGLVVLLQTSKGLASVRVQNDGTARPEPVAWSSR